MLILYLDGQPVPSTNPRDRQKLLDATAKYKKQIEDSEKREKLGRAKLSELKGLIQKQQQAMAQAKRTIAVATTSVKKKRAALTDVSSGSANRSKASRESEEASNVSARVNGVLSALSFTAAKRRDQLNQKRNSSTSSTWVQNLPGLPGPLRKSLWYKMHRRRQQIVLRPPVEYLVSDLREKVTKRIAETDMAKRTTKHDIEEEVMNAEKKFLLAIHPAAPKGESVSSVPSSSHWAEPGKYCYTSQRSLLYRFCCS